MRLQASPCARRAAHGDALHGRLRTDCLSCHLVMFNWWAPEPLGTMILGAGLALILSRR